MYYVCATIAKEGVREWEDSVVAKAVCMFSLICAAFVLHTGLRAHNSVSI